MRDRYLVVMGPSDPPADDTVVRRLHPAVRDVYALSIAHAPERPNVGSIARLMGRSVRQLQRTFHEFGLPAPQRLIALARWVPIADVLRSHREPTRSVASRFGFSSTQSFCRATQRELRMGVPDLRRHGGDLIRRDLATAYQIIDGT